MAALPVQQVVDALHAAGLTLVLTPELALKVTPASVLTPELRDLIRASKDMLIGWLHRNPANDPPPAPAPEGYRQDGRAAFRDKYARARAMRTENTATDPADPDRWSWPHSTAMSGNEIDTFTVRLALFTDKGASLEDAERQADKLVTRDREGDDRRACLECAHLRGAGRWRCGNWHGAGIATRPQDAQLPDELVRQLQRCDGFSTALSCAGSSVNCDATSLMISENL